MLEKQNYGGERERIGTSKSNALTSGPSVTDLKSRHDCSVFVMKWYIFLNFTYPVRCFRVPPKIKLTTTGFRTKCKRRASRFGRYNLQNDLCYAFALGTELEHRTT
jgi:hypothetical protein